MNKKISTIISSTTARFALVFTVALTACGLNEEEKKELDCQEFELIMEGLTEYNCLIGPRRGPRMGPRKKTQKETQEDAQMLRRCRGKTKDDIAQMRTVHMRSDEMSRAWDTYLANLDSLLYTSFSGNQNSTMMHLGLSLGSARELFFKCPNLVKKAEERELKRGG